MDSSVDWRDMYNTNIKHSALYNGTRNFTSEHLQTKMAVDTLLNISSENSSYEDYMYDYDYEAAINHLPLNELVPVTIIYSITLILGLVGNILVIISVARFKKMQNTTNTFLLSLSTADLLLVVICVPVKVRTNKYVCCVPIMVGTNDNVVCVLVKAWTNNEWFLCLKESRLLTNNI